LYGQLQGMGMALLLALPAAGAMGQMTSAAPPSALRFSGFGTLGLTYHDNDTAGAIASYSARSPAESGVSGNLDSVLGLQVDARLGSSTSATLQGVARAGDDLHPRLRMGYLRQQLGADTAVRLGRIRSPLYIDSDVWEIGFANLPVRASPPLYNVAGNYLTHIDGADVQWRHPVGPAALLVQGYLGRSKTTQVLYNAVPEETARAEFTGIRGLALNVNLPSVSMRLSRTWINRFTLRSSQVDQLNGGLAFASGGLLAASANPLLPPPFQAALAAEAAAVQSYSNPFDQAPVYTSLGLDANLGAVRVLGELANLDSRSRMVGKYRGYNLIFGYALGNFTPYAGLSKNRRTTPALDTSAIAPTGLDPTLDGGLAAIRGALDQAALFTDLSTRSRTVGVRWDYAENFAFKLQYESYKTPSSTAPGIFAVRQLPFDNKLDLVSLTLDFVY
jgi:hypothetical protein